MPMLDQETSANNPVPRSERRVAVRVPSKQETCYHFATLDKVAGRWGKVRDISKAGLSLVIDVAFEQGQQVVIEIPSKTAAPAGISARVVRVVDQGGGTWLLGCWFARVLSDEEFKALL